MDHTLVIRQPNLGWTQAQDNIICECIKKNPNNLQYAFECAGIIINKKTSSISCRYYTKLKKEIGLISLSTEKGKLINTKNTLRMRNNKSENFDKLPDLLKKLNKNQKLAIIAILMEL